MKLILVDDDVRFLKSLQMTLGEVHEVHTCRNLAELLKKSNEVRADLLICDFDLGSENIESFLIENSPDIPVLVLTGKATRENIINLLNLGVDAFLEKPIQLEALNRQIQRLTQNKINPVVDVAKKIQIEFDPHFRKISSGGTESDLTPIEYKILTYLLNHFEKPVQKKALQDHLWPNVVVASNTLDTHLSNLKKKAPSLKKHLTSIYGGEYILKAN